jgi:hypothetical protein
VSYLAVKYVLGMMALKRGKTKRARVTAWDCRAGGILLCRGCALTKNAAPFI